MISLGSKSEYQEQVDVCTWLTLHNITFCSVPNGGGGKVRGANLKRSGLSPGAPDLLIFDSVPGKECVGTSLEMKTKKGKPSDDQKDWASKLFVRGWAVLFGYGSDDAIEKLKALGYGKA